MFLSIFLFYSGMLLSISTVFSYSIVSVLMLVMSCWVGIFCFDKNFWLEILLYWYYCLMYLVLFVIFSFYFLYYGYFLECVKLEY